METTEFYGERLRAARLLRGKTLEEVGSAVGVTKGYVQQLENGRTPTEDMALALASALSVTRGFLASPVAGGLSPDEYHFRKRKTTPARVWDTMAAHGFVFLELVRFFEKNLRLEEYRVPVVKVTGPADAEEVARRLRSEWGLGLDVPITNMMRVIESIAGGVATRFHADVDKVDAFSRPAERGTVVCNADKESTSRARFNLAHELAHLAMHRGEKPGLDENERAADIFAAAFLLPAEGFLREFPRQDRVHWPLVFRMKKRWKTSFGVILRRARELGCINDAEYQRSYKQMSAQGWLRNEPEEPPEEPPETIRVCFERLNRRGVSPADVAREIGVTLGDLERVTGLSFGVEVSTLQDSGARVLPFERRPLKVKGTI
ncbi:XRE family transcriptional regulator [Archangium sp.]|jgi:Zn-dependent peptidase ImmA (M78 family)/DNA-binding XRE family transcriptional regulator|uniref:helix-turn-helix domain-containing protein n=1 Tax=Archangium sp. TaxID=1872627 RepID=UPI002ED7BB40